MKKFDYKRAWAKLLFKLAQLLQSKTFWMIVLMVTVSVVQNLKKFFDPVIFTAITSGLGVLASYFKITPSQDYTKELPEN